MRTLFLVFFAVAAVLFTVLGALGANAVAITDTAPVTYNYAAGGWSDTDVHGTAIKMTYNTTIKEVRITGNSTGSIYIIATGNNSVMASSSQNGANKNATFNLTVTAGIEYCVGVSVRSADNISYSDTAQPTAATAFNWTARCIYHTNGGAVQNSAGRYYTVVAIVTENASQTSPPGTPTWVAPTPANGSANNTQVTLNASTSGSGVRYFVYFDTNPNPTTLVVNNATSGNWTTNVTTDGTYYYKAMAWNASGYSSNTTVQTWVYDTTMPIITLNPNNQFNSSNMSTRNPYGASSILLNISFSDVHALYGFSVNITRGGVSYYNETNTTLSGTSANYSRNVSTTGWPAGPYNVSIEADDSHTTQRIRDYLTMTNASGFRFQTDEGNDLAVVSLNGSVLASTRRLVDRYTFRFNFTDGQVRARTFLIHSFSNPIVYLPNSSYPAHFVIVGPDGMRGNWIDFAGVPGVPVVRQLNEKSYLVTFLTLAPDVEFQSIGGLNVKVANFTMFLGNYSLSGTTAYSLEPVLLSLNATNDSSIASITAQLFYNGTLVASNSSSSSTAYSFSANVLNPNVTLATNLSYYWTLNVTQNDGSNFLFNATGTNQVQVFGLSICGGTPYINWTMYDEDTRSNLLNGTLSVEMTYWIGNKANAQIYNTTFPAGNSWSLCFTPANTTFYADIYAKNAVPGGFTHRFFVQNGTFSNVTTYYKLLSPNSSNAASYSNLEITVRRTTDYKYLRNIFVQLQRKYLDTGTWNTVQWDKSGDYGLLIFDVMERSVDYRLIFTDENNSVLKVSDSLKFACAGGACQLTQLLSPANATTTSSSVSSGYSFNNATRLLVVNWTGSSTTTSTVSIKVVKQGTTTTVCSTTQTGNAGSYSCNASGYTGTLYLTIDANGKPLGSAYIELGKQQLGSFLGTTFGALLTFILALTIVGFGLFSPWALTIATVLSVFVVFLVGTLTAVTVGFLTLAVVIGLVIGSLVRQ